MKSVIEYIRKFNSKMNNRFKNKTKWIISSLAHIVQKDQKVVIKKGKNLQEQYYKQRLIYCLEETRKFSSSQMLLEFPICDGNKKSENKKPDITIFDDSKWKKHWEKYNSNNYDDQRDLDWLESHMLLEVEAKTPTDGTLQDAWSQLKSYMQRSSRSITYGILLFGNLIYLIKRHNNKYYRISTNKNATDSFNSHDSDSVENISTFDDLCKDTVSTIIPTFSTIQPIRKQTNIRGKLNDILKSLDTNSLNKYGFSIIIQTIAAKIYNEKMNNTKKLSPKPLDFHVTDKEYNDVSGKYYQRFKDRLSQLLHKASEKYPRIITLKNMNFKNPSVVDIIKEIVYQFQWYSFVKSKSSNLYRLVFYQFANKFEENKNAEFLTPLSVINFLVDLVHPKRGDSLCDPTVGTADFLSAAYSKSAQRGEKLDDSEIYGMDIDPQIIKLAQLNMMLNGDGNSTLVTPSSRSCGSIYGSLLYKFSNQGQFMSLLDVINDKDWNNQKTDLTPMKKFDVILTNPPFGRGRAFDPNKDDIHKKIAHKYELYNMLTTNKNGKQIDKKIDKGVLFLENMVKSLNPHGRYGLVISSAITSVISHKIARKWLIDHTRIVGIFDLPTNTFIDTPTTTTIIVGYKPTSSDKNILSDYKIFADTIHNVGYKARTINRIRYPQYIYKRNPKKNFHIIRNKYGDPVLDEDFTKAIQQFNEWKNTQESFVQKNFGD